MKKSIVAVMLAGALSAGMLAGCGNNAQAQAQADAAAAEAAVSEAVDVAVSEAVDEAVAEEVVSEAVEAASEITFVDGFYANSGDEDFMIAFYENAPGDVCYINDGTNEVLAEYTVEDATLADGTAYLLVTVGNTQLGYVDDGTDCALIDADGNVYAAAHLSEEEADSLYEMLSQ